MTSSRANPPIESLTIKIIRVGLLIAVALLACFVMALDPNQPY